MGGIFGGWLRQWVDSGRSIARTVSDSSMCTDDNIDDDGGDSDGEAASLLLTVLTVAQTARRRLMQYLPVTQISGVVVI